MLVSSADLSPVCITVADMQSPGIPLVYVNATFTRTTQYPVESCLGRNCRFLQGAGTTPESVEAIRAALRKAEPLSIDVVNYRKDGTPFRNLLSLKPVFEVITASSLPQGVEDAEATPPDVYKAPVFDVLPSHASFPALDKLNASLRLPADTDGHGHYKFRLAFFLGIQYEVTTDAMRASRLVRLEALVRMLPSVIWHEDAQALAAK